MVTIDRLIDLFQLRPPLPRVPAFLKLRLGLFQGRHTIRARHRTVGVHGPEPAQTVGAAAGLVDAADLPLTCQNDVVRPVLVDAGAKTGWAELKGHRTGR